MIKSIKKNYLFFSFLFIYIIIGSYLSLQTGISHDEIHENNNWIVNFSAIKDFFNTGSYDSLLNYKDKYHGIAFQFISQPVQFFLKSLLIDNSLVTEFGALLLSKHPVVFIFFSISGIFYYLIIFKITDSRNFSFATTVIYLIYPYLFGHAQFNPKDIPFLSFWIINTFFSLKLIENFYYEKKINLNSIILISFLTAFLVSIRIVGLLIFIQYFISLIIYFEKTKVNFLKFLKINILNIISFILLFFLFIYILNPIFWHNPLEILNSIKWMSKYPQNIGTLTNGSLMYSLSLPSSYYFIWLFYKLPIIIIVGYLLYPFVESTIFKNDIVTIYYGTITIIAPIILVIFILMDVAVYDELRHLLFIVPLIFITATINIFYFKNKIIRALIPLTIIFFIFENFSLNPYQYTWLNSFAKFKDIEKNFEIDYWGISNRSLQKQIINYVDKNQIDKNICIFGDKFTKDFLMPSSFQCFKNYTQIDSQNKKPFIAYKNLRNVRRSNLQDCELIWDETYQYSFYKKKISVGSLWICN